MNDNVNRPTDIVDQLSHDALLDLAAKSPSHAAPPRPYTLPTAEELTEAFPELEIGQLIGTGGMGCVFKATQNKLDRAVALKILPRELSRDGLFAERFAREARAMARLNHPGVVGVYDFGESGEFHYLIMEYMDGMNLRELMDAGPIEPSEALRIFEQVCLALAYAHTEGVIHRDIKPENILFNRIGHVALADFGLARLAMDSNCEVSLTQTRQAMGTLNYMAPEQWENPKTVDHRADVYALGVLLYEVLTGRIPRGSFPPASSISDVPTEVDDVINTALQQNPDDRFQSVAALVETLVGQIPATATGEPYRFSANGTVTNFMHLGAAVFDRIPRPKPRTAMVEPIKSYTPTQLCIIVFVLATVLSLFPWHSHSPGFTDVTEYFLGYFETPNFLMNIELLLICLLNWKKDRIHPIRARFLCLVLTGFCLAQVGVFTFNRGDSELENLTIAPFVFMLVVGLFAAELVVGTAVAVFRWMNDMAWKSYHSARSKT